MRTPHICPQCTTEWNLVEVASSGPVPAAEVADHSPFASHTQLDFSTLFKSRRCAGPPWLVSDVSKRAHDATTAWEGRAS
jgi:hypothetical protein